MASAMMRIIPLSEKEDKIIALPGLWRAKMPARKQIPIRFGHRKITAALRYHKKNAHEVYLSKGVMEDLLIPYNDPLLIRIEEEGLVVGPLIGIVTSGLRGDSDHLQKKRFLRVFRSLLNPARPGFPGGFYFLFDYKDVDWDAHTVKGYFYRPQGRRAQWETKKIPFPDVVYNKILSRKIEEAPDVKQFFDLLNAQTHAPMFNEAYFQKWDIYQRLFAFDEIRPLIPETHPYPTAKIMKEMLERYPMIYLKPNDGFLGLGIYQVMKQVKGIRVRYRSGDRNLSRSYPSIQLFLKENLPERKRKKYLVQQGIPLMRLDDDPVDFRVHLNKDRENQWIITGVGAKKAGKGSVTTHIRSGGKALDAEEVLKSFFESRGEEMYDKLKETAVKVAVALEDSFQKPIGELGLDLGIDRSGHLWIFEANSKPGRSIFEKIESLKKESGKPLKLLTEYMAYLAKFA